MGAPSRGLGVDRAAHERHAVEQRHGMPGKRRHVLRDRIGRTQRSGDLQGQPAEPTASRREVREAERGQRRGRAERVEQESWPPRARATPDPARSSPALPALAGLPPLRAISFTCLGDRPCMRRCAVTLRRATDEDNRWADGRGPSRDEHSGTPGQELLAWTRRIDHRAALVPRATNPSRIPSCQRQFREGGAVRR